MAEPATAAGPRDPPNAVDAMLAPIRESGLENPVLDYIMGGRSTSRVSSRSSSGGTAMPGPAPRSRSCTATRLARRRACCPQRTSARFRRLMGVDDPMGWKEHGPDGELFIKLAARQTVKDEDTLRANSRR